MSIKIAVLLFVPNIIFGQINSNHISFSNNQVVDSVFSNTLNRIFKSNDFDTIKTFGFHSQKDAYNYAKKFSNALNDKNNTHLFNKAIAYSDFSFSYSKGNLSIHEFIFKDSTIAAQLIHLLDNESDSRLYGEAPVFFKAYLVNSRIILFTVSSISDFSIHSKFMECFISIFRLEANARRGL